MRHAFVSIFTDGTNEDWDFAKIMGAFGIVIFLCISFYAYGGAAFGPIEWATGFSLIMASAAGMSKLKNSTTPTDTQKSS